MFLEQKPTNSDFGPINSRLNTASIVEIADFFNKAVERKQFKNPKLSPYMLFKSVAASGFLLGIHDDVMQKALEAMTGEDVNKKLAGRDAFFFLAMETIFTVVESNFNKKRYTAEDREEMFNSAIISVMENASSINRENTITSQVKELAQLGVLSYICDESEGLGAVRVSANKGTGKVKDSEWDKIYRNTELKIDVGNALNTLDDHSRKVIESLYGLKGGPRKTRDEVGREFGGLCGQTIYLQEVKTLRRLRHPSRKKFFQGYR
jgi:hypothetical protein